MKIKQDSLKRLSALGAGWIKKYSKTLFILKKCVSNAFRLWGRVGYTVNKKGTAIPGNSLKRLSALGAGWITLPETREIVLQSSWSQTPFGFGGGLDALFPISVPEKTISSQTPFGFGGGLDIGYLQYNLVYRKIKSQTPFGFGGGLDTGIQYSFFYRNLQAHFGRRTILYLSSQKI